MVHFATHLVLIRWPVFGQCLLSRLSCLHLRTQRDVCHITMFLLLLKQIRPLLGLPGDYHHLLSLWGDCHPLLFSTSDTLHVWGTNTQWAFPSAPISPALNACSQIRWYGCHIPVAGHLQLQSQLCSMLLSHVVGDRCSTAPRDDRPHVGWTRAVDVCSPPLQGQYMDPFRQHQSSNMPLSSHSFQCLTPRELQTQQT